jgi:peptidoglycan/LPS O-acetylase OafA/YrhL
MNAANNSTAHHTNNFDLLRLLAALQVVIGHSCAWLKIPLPTAVDQLMRCFPGVAIFFVISGFLITNSWLLGSQRPAIYLAHRMLRIYPALWLQYVFVFLIMAVTGGFAFITITNFQFWKWVTTAAFMGSNFWAGALTQFNPFNWDGLFKWYPADVLWTIPVELGFYLLVPLIFSKWIITRNLAGLTLLAFFSLSVVTAYYAGPLLRDHGNLNSTGMLHSSPAPYLWLFLAGAFAAFNWTKISYWFEGKAFFWILLVTIGSVANWMLTESIALPYRIPDALTIPRALCLAGLVIALAHTWTFLSGWLRGVDISYGLYLFHLPFPFGMYYAGFGGSIWYLFASIIIAFVLATASWFLVEKRALSLKPAVSAWFASRI